MRARLNASREAINHAQKISEAYREDGKRGDVLPEK